MASSSDDASSLAPSAELTTLFWTGFVDVLESAESTVAAFSESHFAVPSADQRRICPLEPPDGMCLLPLVVGCVYLAPSTSSFVF